MPQVEEGMLAHFATAGPGPSQAAPHAQPAQASPGFVAGATMPDAINLPPAPTPAPAAVVAPSQ
eukprot:2064391-Prymnesium_polylepis.1